MKSALLERQEGCLSAPRSLGVDENAKLEIIIKIKIALNGQKSEKITIYDFIKSPQLFVAYFS
jgi:hypothetical protein